jgi:hypothetical protein
MSDSFNFLFSPSIYLQIVLTFPLILAGNQKKQKILIKVNILTTLN